jgi:hypothetical protein
LTNVAVSTAKILSRSASSVRPLKYVTTVKDESLSDDWGLAMDDARHESQTPKGDATTRVRTQIELAVGRE